MTRTEFISFADVIGGSPPGTNYDGVFFVDGVAFGERFIGLTLTAEGNFDQLGGAPAGGLTLIAGTRAIIWLFFQSLAGPVLIQPVVLGNLPLTATYGVSRDGGLADIRGISIWNDDLTGIGLAGFRHNVQSAIPEPSTWAMMLLDFGAVGSSLRRRKVVQPRRAPA